METLSGLLGLKPKIEMDEAWGSMSRSQKDRDNPVHFEKAMCRGEGGSCIYLYSLSPLRFALYTDRKKTLLSVVRAMELKKVIHKHIECDGEGILVFTKTHLPMVTAKFPLRRAGRSTTPETTKKRAANAKKARKSIKKSKTKV
jgi:hypothetical protein